MTIDQVHTYIGYAYTIGTGLGLVFLGLGRAFPKVTFFSLAAKAIGSAVADFSKLGGDK